MRTVRVEDRVITGEAGPADGRVDRTAIHEAAHAVALIFAGSSEQLGGATAHWSGEHASGICFFNNPPPEMAYKDVRKFWLAGLVASLAGYMMDGSAMQWPPPFQVACTETLEDIGFQIQRLGLDEARWKQVVKVARNMVADPLFRRAVHDVARLLAVTPEASADEIIALADLPEGA